MISFFFECSQKKCFQECNYAISFACQFEWFFIVFKEGKNITDLCGCCSKCTKICKVPKDITGEEKIMLGKIAEITCCHRKPRGSP